MRQQRICARAPRILVKTSTRKISAIKTAQLVGEALTDFGMLENGDKVMVLSGGKDSYTLLDLMLSFQQHAPIHFDVVAVNLDQKQPGFPEHVLPAYLTDLGVNFDVIEQDTYNVVQALTPEGKTTCPVCSRLRRVFSTATQRKLAQQKSP